MDNCIQCTQAELERVMDMLRERGYSVGNVDATIVAQRPKLSPHIPHMRDVLARTMGIELDRLNIKATTEEGLGFTGEGLGISAHAVALLHDE